MREVIPSLVWIGNARDASDLAAVLALEITAVVHLVMEELPTLFPREITYCQFPLFDGEGNQPVILRTAIHTVSVFIEANAPILVACSGGMSPSPAVVAAAIACARGEPADEG